MYVPSDGKVLFCILIMVLIVIQERKKNVDDSCQSSILKNFSNAWNLKVWEAYFCFQAATLIVFLNWNGAYPFTQYLLVLSPLYLSRLFLEHSLKTKRSTEVRDRKDCEMWQGANPLLWTFLPGVSIICTC